MCHSWENSLSEIYEQFYLLLLTVGQLIELYMNMYCFLYIAMCPIYHINHIFTDWKVDGHQQLSWVTQTCATKVEGRVDVYCNFNIVYRVILALLYLQI